MTEPARPGLFLTFEGADGSGKTTQFRRLTARLRAAGYGVLETAEPGGTPIGQRIRAILLDPANQEMHRSTEMLLYFASRAQNVHQWIRPALERGDVVVCDRYTDSTLAYQGGGRGFSDAVVLALHDIATDGLQPGVTIYLDIDAETGLDRARAGREALDRMDAQSLAFHRQVRATYLRLAAAHPDRYRVIDATPAAADVERAVWSVVERELEARGLVPPAAEPTHVR